MPHHPSRSSHLYDVVIAGAGPVGLFLACELRLHGLSVLVMERAAHPESPLKGLPFGLRGLSVPTLEAFDRRGMLTELAAAAHDRAGLAAQAHWQQQSRRPAGHFAGIQFYQDQVDTTQWPYRLPGSASAHMAVSMATLETVLTRRAQTMAVEIRHDHGVDDLAVAGDVVTVTAGQHCVRGRWPVGCDGGRSAVRRLAGFDFVGTDPEFTGYSIEAELSDPHALLPGRHLGPAGMFTFARPGTIAMVEFDGGAHHRRTPLTLDHVQAVLQRVSGLPIVLTGLRQASTWTDHARQATRYRRARVLLAGDAAHVHSPLGGQGLNLGIGDAMNLGWKLAATVRGDAPSDLLDSYQLERHPVGAEILDWSRAQVALMRPTPGTRALAAIVGDLIATTAGASYFAQRMWGIALRYDVGQAHALAGRSAPDFVLRGIDELASLASALRAGKGVLLEFEGRAELAVLARRWITRVRHVTVSAANPIGVRSLLVRPDGVEAWACDGVPDLQALSQSLLRWFGAPSCC